jgi:hypothetical protein
MQTERHVKTNSNTNNTVTKKFTLGTHLQSHNHLHHNQHIVYPLYLDLILHNMLNHQHL